MKKNMFTVFLWSGLILFGGAVSGSAQLNFSSASANKLQKSQRKAEKIVVQAIKKFGRTLDFAGVYQETFVTDKIIRQSEDKPLLAGFINRQTLNRIDAATLEQAYVKSQNLYWMFAAYSLQKDGTDIARIEHEIRPSLNEKQLVIYERIMSERDNPAAESTAEIADCLAVYEKMTHALRQKIKPALRRRLQRDITARASRIAPTAAAENVFRVSLQLDGEQFPLSFTAVEKSGVIKILSVAVDD